VSACVRQLCLLFDSFVVVSGFPTLQGGLCASRRWLLLLLLLFVHDLLAVTLDIFQVGVGCGRPLGLVWRLVGRQPPKTQHSVSPLPSVKALGCLHLTGSSHAAAGPRVRVGASQGATQSEHSEATLPGTQGSLQQLAIGEGSTVQYVCPSQYLCTSWPEGWGRYDNQLCAS
jgi:hypothetical protein